MFLLQIVNYFQVLVAANRAVHLNRTKKMLTKNVHSEILFSLSPSKNVTRHNRFTIFYFSLVKIIVVENLKIVKTYICLKKGI